MEPRNNKKASHSDHRKQEKASKKKAEVRKKEAFYGNASYGYYEPFNNGYGYGHGHPYLLHDGYYSYIYGWPEHYCYDESVVRASLGYKDGFNHYGNLHFGDIDPYQCYQSLYETPVMSFPQAPPPHQTHPFYNPETVCSIM